MKNSNTDLEIEIEVEIDEAAEDDCPYCESDDTSQAAGHGVCNECGQEWSY